MTITLNPSHRNISMHILFTVLYTFPIILMRRISRTFKTFFEWVVISNILITLMFDSAVMKYREIRHWSLLVVEGLMDFDSFHFQIEWLKLCWLLRGIYTHQRFHNKLTAWMAKLVDCLLNSLPRVSSMAPNESRD